MFVGPDEIVDYHAGSFYRVKVQQYLKRKSFFKKKKKPNSSEKGKKEENLIWREIFFPIKTVASVCSNTGFAEKRISNVPYTGNNVFL